DAIALLDRLAGLDVELAHDARDFGDHGDLHLHRLEDAYLVALGDHLALLDDDLPHVRGDLRADLGHGGGSYAASEILAVSAHALVVLEAHGLPEHLRDLTIAFDQRTQSSRTRGAQPVPGLRVETSREPEAALLRVDGHPVEVAAPAVERRDDRAHERSVFRNRDEDGCVRCVDDTCKVVRRIGGARVGTCTPPELE